MSRNAATATVAATVSCTVWDNKVLKMAKAIFKAIFILYTRSLRESGLM
jgi:hypothetical protein